MPSLAPGPLMVPCLMFLLSGYLDQKTALFSIMHCYEHGYEQDFRGSGKNKTIYRILSYRARGRRARADHATWPVSLKRHRMAMLGHFENRCPLGYWDSVHAVCD